MVSCILLEHLEHSWLAVPFRNDQASQRETMTPSGARSLERVVVSRFPREH